VRLVALVVVAVVLLTVVMTAVSPAKGAGPRVGLARLRGGSGFVVDRLTSEGVYVGRCVFWLVAPSASDFSVYIINNNNYSINIAMYLNGKHIGNATVPPRGQIQAAKVHITKPGVAELRLEASPIRNSFNASDIKVGIVASGGSGRLWTIALGAGALLVAGGIAALFSLLARGAIRGWIPGLIGLIIIPAYGYYHGPPAPRAIYEYSPIMKTYVDIASIMRDLMPMILILSSLMGVFAAYYPRSSGWETGEVIFGKWGLSLAVRRILVGSLSLALSVIGALVIFMVVDGYLEVLHGFIRYIIKILAIDLACVFMVALAFSVFSSAVSFASRSPLLGLALSILVAFTLFNVPCTLGIGGEGTDHIIRGSTIIHSYHINLDSKIRYFNNSVVKSVELALAGVAIWAIAWLRR